MFLAHTVKPDEKTKSETERNKTQKHTRFVVLVGSTDNNLEIYHEMSGSEDTGYSVVGYFDGQANPAFPVECPYLGTLKKCTRWFSQ